MQSAFVVCDVRFMSASCFCGLQKPVEPSKASSLLVKFPAAELTGHSVAESFSINPQRRLPTVFHVFTGGQRFALDSVGPLGPDADPVEASRVPGAVLMMRNWTVLAPNITWNQLQNRNNEWHRFFDIPPSTRVCFGDSCVFRV
jgi:hypothetical protein